MVGSGGGTNDLITTNLATDPPLETADKYACFMHSYKPRQIIIRRSYRFERMFRLDPHVQPSDVAAFLALDPKLQFEELRELRRDAAHLGGGSFSALVAVYVSAALVAYPLIVSGAYQLADVNIQPLIVGLGVAAIGLVLALNFALTQNNLARSAARLAFYEKALEERRAVRIKSHRWWLFGKQRGSNRG